MDLNVEIIGIVAAVLTSSGFVPQIYKSLKTKRVEGVSLTMFLVLFAGIICWLIYGILINSFSIIMANIVSGLLVFTQIILRLIYREKGS